MARRGFRTHPLVVRRVRVAEAHDLTPRMRRVVVSGDQLGRFDAGGTAQPPFAAPGFDDHVKLVFAADGDVDAVAPRQLAHGIEWPSAEGRLDRDYTPWPLPDGRVALDFVQHGDGPAISWSRRARPGDEICLVGPKSSTLLPDELDWIILAGDETALPAIGRFLAERPSTVPAQVVVELGDPSGRQELRERPGDTVAWVAPGELEGAVRGLRVPAGAGYLWAAGEARDLLGLRRWARDLGLDRSRVNITGYWHRGNRQAERRSAVASPVGWLVVRAAVRLGLLDAVAESPRPVAELAAATGQPAAVLGMLSDLLVGQRILTRTPDGVLGLGPSGEMLLIDEHQLESFDGFDAELVLSLAALDGAVRRRVSPWQLRSGHTLRSASLADPDLYGELMEQSENLGYLLDGLFAASWWTGLRRLTLTGPGALTVWQAVQERRTRATPPAPDPGPEITLVEEEPALAVLRASATDEALGWASDLATASAGGDAVVAALVAACRTDAELAGWLRTVEGPRLVLLESTSPDRLSPRAAETVLRTFAATGSAARSTADLAAAAAACGWTSDEVIDLGWGFQALVFTR
ncbi:MAG: siderophore-interacting protein [Nocardioides sp.]|uniref:siderophore-interacting protein n=1 Tax=Nocardioides sp. TaxID=35761 RepID=UPI0039E60ED4